MLIIGIIFAILGIVVFMNAQKKKEEERKERRRIHEWTQTDEYKEYTAKKELEEKQRRVREKDCYSVPFNEPPAVTGDYFSVNFCAPPGYPYGYSGGKEYDCKFKNSASCAYCCRREEIHLEDNYYYGTSKHCTYYTND